MALGQRLKQARQEAGLSQRQLCGEVITRNMLSQIENGGARPSMDTLRYLAGRLGKPVGYFLEEETASVNQTLMAKARSAYEAGEYAGTLELLRDYRPDGIFDAEMALLESMARLNQAELALEENRRPYAAALLQEVRGGIYWSDALERRRLLLLARALPEETERLADRLPSDDEALLLRAEAAQKGGQWQKSICLLEAAEDQTAPRWCLLRGEACFALEDYTGAIGYFQLVEEQALARLESCYERLGDYKMAYHYAKKQR